MKNPRMKNMILPATLSFRGIPALILLISLLASLFILAAFVSRLDINCNDDAYVYFTYARNFVQGRLFAYDPRNIPSEGFTSIIYLLMLIPFEWAGVNMMFASAILSIAGIIMTSFLASVLLYRNRYLKGIDVFLHLPLLLAIILLNANTLIQIGWGLDTSWGFMFILAAIIFLCEILKPVPDDSRRRIRLLVYFYLALFLSLLCRPENIAYAALLCFYGFFSYPMRKTYLKGFLGFIMLILFYGIWKMIYFKNLFPTAFFRKMGDFDKGIFPGLSYNISFFKSSIWPIFIVIVGLTIYLSYSLKKNSLKRFVCNNHPLILLVFCGVVNVLVVMMIVPLIGFGFRFLFTLQCILAILLSWLAVHISTLIAIYFSKRFLTFSKLIPLGFLIFLIFIVAWRAVPSRKHPEPLIERLDLSKRADSAVEQHQYVRFGRFLREKLPDYESITLVFGDAGAIPYEFGCRFIDMNGLTEPYIAHLFYEKDSNTRAEKYARYILDLKPDIIVLNTGALEGGRSIIRPNFHSPFGGEMKIAVWEAFKNEGFRYLVSLPMYYDLHIGVNSQSLHLDKIITALESYARTNNGYYNHEGLTVSIGNCEVHFESYNVSNEQ